MVSIPVSQEDGMSIKKVRDIFKKQRSTKTHIYKQAKNKHQSKHQNKKELLVSMQEEKLN